MASLFLMYRPDSSASHVHVLFTSCSSPTVPQALATPSLSQTCSYLRAFALANPSVRTILPLISTSCYFTRGLPRDALPNSPSEDLCHLIPFKAWSQSEGIQYSLSLIAYCHSPRRSMSAPRLQGACLSLSSSNTDLVQFTARVGKSLCILIVGMLVGGRGVSVFIINHLPSSATLRGASQPVCPGQSQSSKSCVHPGTDRSPRKTNKAGHPKCRIALRSRDAEARPHGIH